MRAINFFIQNIINQLNIFIKGNSTLIIYFINFQSENINKKIKEILMKKI